MGVSKVQQAWCLVLGVLLVGSWHRLQAQQLPARSPFASNSFVWNPAMTAFDNEWETGITHLQEWVGFEDAPQNTNLYVAYPFTKQRFSLGGFLMLDEISPIRQNEIGLTYAYKLGFGPRKRKRKAQTRQEAQLSLGLMLAVQQVFINNHDYIVQDIGDPLQPVGELTLVSPNVGFGAFFASKPTGVAHKSYFFAGAGTNQLLPNDITFREANTPTGNLKRVFHGNATIGYHAHGSVLIIEPSLWFNAAGRNLRNSQFNLHIEYPRAFWAGLGYNLNQTLFLQAGYLLPNSLTKGDTIRLGLMTSFNTGSFGNSRGIGYGFTLAYRTQ
ncbi:MAG: PorP/SprF family type IX secretion system membrane protein [Saprospiraceae bacterium]